MIDLKLSVAVGAVVSKIGRGERIGCDDAATLWGDAPLAVLGALAAEIKRKKSGDAVFYNRNFHVEPTNVCVFRCRFCSYRREAGESGAWCLSLDEIAGIARRYAGSRTTEAHIVGGVHPDHDLAHYAEMVRTVKRELPHVTVKAYTAIELDYMIAKAGLTTEEGLRLLRDAGMEAIPGGGAEIFDERLRESICPEKGDARRWLSLHETAHGLGIRSNATMLYGHVESVAHRIDHLARLRELQDRTGGFDAFIPLKFRSRDNEMSSAGEVSVVEDLRTLAISRIFLDNFPHIKAYWPMYGRTTAELALAYGADDMDGTIDDTTRIYSMAGAEEQSPSMSADEMEALIARAGYRAVERDTFYNPVKK